MRILAKNFPFTVRLFLTLPNGWYERLEDVERVM
jgi:hypothetical protein